jgi:hypothetical protein
MQYNAQARGEYEAGSLSFPVTRAGCCLPLFRSFLGCGADAVSVTRESRLGFRSVEGVVRSTQGAWSVQLCYLIINQEHVLSSVEMFMRHCHCTMLVDGVAWG